MKAVIPSAALLAFAIQCGPTPESAVSKRRAELTTKLATIKGIGNGLQTMQDATNKALPLDIDFVETSKTYNAEFVLDSDAQDFARPSKAAVRPRAPSSIVNAERALQGLYPSTKSGEQVAAELDRFLSLRYVAWVHIVSFRPPSQVEGLAFDPGAIQAETFLVDIATNSILRRYKHASTPPRQGDIFFHSNSQGSGAYLTESLGNLITSDVWTAVQKETGKVK